MNDPAVIPTGYGLYLLQTLLALGAVCLLAYVVLRWGAKRIYGVGRPGQAMRVVERLPLEPRRSLFLVEVEGRRLVVGSSESGLSLVTALKPPDDAEEPTTTRVDRSPAPG